MDTEKLYTIEMTAQEVLFCTAVVGNSSTHDATRHLSNYQKFIERDFKNVLPLLEKMKGSSSQDRILSKMLRELYQKLYNTVDEQLAEDFKPKTKKIYFCLYESSYGKPAEISSVYEDKEQMLTVLTNAKIIEVFEREIPV